MNYPFQNFGGQMPGQQMMQPLGQQGFGQMPPQQQPPMLGQNMMQGAQQQPGFGQMPPMQNGPQMMQPLNMPQQQQGGGMSLMQKFGMLSPFLSAMQHGGHGGFGQFAQMMSPLAFGLHKAKVF